MRKDVTHATNSFQLQRQLWIDAVKGIAILLVLISHSDFWTFCNNHSQIPGFTHLKYIISLAIASYMPLFYFISGYTFKDRPNIISQRFKRLIPPYFKWGIAALLYTWGIIYANGGNMRDYLTPAAGLIYSRFLLLPENSSWNIHLFPLNAAPLWFLTSLFTSYILFILLIRIKCKKTWLLIGLLGLNLLLSFCPILLPWSIDTAAAGALFIYVGYTMKENRFFQHLIPSKSRLTLCSLLISCFYIILVRYNGGINMSIRQYGNIPLLSPFLFIIIGLMGSFLFCILCITMERFKLIKAAVYLGQISLILLCSHAFSYTAIGYVLKMLSTTFDCSLFSIKFLFIWQIPTAIVIAVLISKIKSCEKIQYVCHKK